ncbi:Retrotransposon-derived protein PEG10 [Merluccius polli]|uniref:Retrotransposon-derived protein PEG10 n=1 Tax=Merluccius polli TaxID=89951 RepID=A0AA47MGG0_MERPO|nr:Retrotransposon-derived protein PEG10 [Merluccius polli]
MDSAEVGRLAEALGAQKDRLSRQEEFQSAMATHMGQLTSHLQELIAQLPRPTAPAPVPAPPTAHVGAGSKLAPPAQYNGEPGMSKTFLIDCSIHFELTPHAFPTDRSKIAFMISHLTGRAKAWASAEWGRCSPICNSLADFQTALSRTFDPVSDDREKAQELSGLRQGKDSVCDYAIRFRTLSAESGWNSTALYDGLAAPIQDLLVPLDLPTGLDELIALAVRTDNRLGQLRRHREDRTARTEGVSRSQTQGRPASYTFPPVQHNRIPAEEEGIPMQLGRARLTQEERRKRLLEGRCFYCGETGHLVLICPAKQATALQGVQARVEVAEYVAGDHLDLVVVEDELAEAHWEE